MAKQISAADGKLIGIVDYSDYEHISNSWRYRIWLHVPDAFDNRRGNDETVIEGKRMVAIAGKADLASEARASAACIQQLGEMLERVTSSA